MKANKVLLGSFLLAGLASACTNEEIVVAEQGNNVDLSSRTQVDFSFGLPMESRMAATGENKMGQGFTENDLLGAVLVDGGYDASKTENQVDWTIVNGHVGNNKWAYNPEANNKKGAFETAGTTSVGAWLFYTKYNELMTTTRDGVKFSFPQIQEGAADFTYLANNNANFMITPILAIDGYEGSRFDLELKYASVYNYLNLKFDFSALEDADVTNVQKIIVKATDKNGNSVKFPTYGKVINKNIPVAELSLEVNDEVAVEDLNDDNVINVADQNLAISYAYDKLRYREYQTNKYGYVTVAGNKVTTEATKLWANPINYNPIVTTADATKDVEYLVVDFETEHADVAGKGGLAVEDGLFSAFMLMPSGVYGSITFEIYTNDGVYEKVVTTRNAFIENEEVATGATAKGIAKGKGEIFLRPNVATVLSNIEGVETKVDGKTVSDYLKVGAQLEGDLITKTADLVNFINGITAGGTYDLTVITQGQIGDSSNGVDDKEFAAHTAALINKAVMDAIEAKEAELAGDIQLILNSVKPITVIGEKTAEAPLYIHDIQFNNSCEVVSGYVTVGDAKDVQDTELIIPADQKMLVKSGVNLVLNNRYQQLDKFAKIEIESGANVTIKNHLWINEVVNAGTVVAETELESVNVTNSGSIEAKNLFKVEEILTNKGTITSGKTMEVLGALINNKYATITNNGVLTLGDKSENSNNGTINNNDDLNVTGNLNNGGTINNAKEATIKVDKTAALNNNAGAVITNEGSMRCISGTGENKINNLGIIYAKEDSRTYITTNSSAEETVNGTNELTMGTIILDNRNEDMSVTVGAQQGYIQYTVPAAIETLEYVKGDKFNKVVLSGKTTLDESMVNRIKYIVVDAALKLDLPETAKIQEIEFNANTVLYSTGAKLALIKIGKNVEVTVPTENAIYVQDAENSLTVEAKVFKSKTLADIENKGEMIVGGDLYSTLPESITKNNGVFSSGDGENTAYHWNTAVTTDGYTLIGSTAKVNSPEGLTNALADATVEKIELNAGNYNMPTTTGDVTIAGDVETVINITTPKADNVTLSGVTVKSNGKNYQGIQHSNKVVYENCVIKGKQHLYANEVLIKDCIVDLTEVVDYIWTYGAKNVVFDNCIFNTNGKAILIYNETSDLVTNVTVKNCTFNATASAAETSGAIVAAIEIDSSLSKNGHYTLTTENNTVDSDFSGEWRIKKSGTDNTTVNGVVYNAITIDGVAQ